MKERPITSNPWSRHKAFFAALCVLCTLPFAFAQESHSPRPKPDVKKGSDTNSGSLVARGNYIVESLAVCSQCHTPRDGYGNPDHAHWLEGAAVWLKPAEPSENWPLLAPRIAGTPPGTDEEMVKLLTTGIWRDGKPLRPPMPQFRMTSQDAEAVVAYLKSVRSGPR